MNQCIHTGFGLHKFKEELTGPEYAWRYETQVKNTQIKIKVDTMVQKITADKIITYSNEQEGTVEMQAESIILATGCRERTRASLHIPGTRPAGIYTARHSPEVCECTWLFARA